MSDYAKREPTTEERMTRGPRIMPYSQESEAGLLSAMLQDPARLIPEIAAKMTEEMFYHRPCREVFKAVLRLAELNKPVDHVAVIQLMTESNTLANSGGNSWVMELYGFIPHSSNVLYYRKIVLRDWLRRKMIEACAFGMDAAFDFADSLLEGEEPDAQLMLSQVENRVFNVLQLAQSAHDGSSGPRKAKEFMPDYIDHLQRVMANVGKITGLQTGLPDVDRIICGLDDKRGEMLVVGARPGHGKTALLGTWLKNMCIDSGIPTLMFSMEMATDQIMDRVVFGGFDINTNKARTGMLSDHEKDTAIPGAIRKVACAELWVDESADLNTVEFRSRVQMMVRLHGIRLLIVDYLQLIKACTKIGRSEERLEITEALQMLHHLKKEHKLVILVAAQLNQNIEKTPGRRHMLSDFAGSDAIGKFADYAMFIVRPAEVKRWKDLKPKTKEETIKLWRDHRMDQPELWSGQKVRVASQSAEKAAPIAEVEEDWTETFDDKGKGKGSFNPDETPGDAMQTTLLTLENGSLWNFDNEKDWDESAELQLVKNRNGPTPDIPIRFRREFARFDTRTPKLFSNNLGERQNH